MVSVCSYYMAFVIGSRKIIENKYFLVGLKVERLCRAPYDTGHGRAVPADRVICIRVSPDPACPPVRFGYTYIPAEPSIRLFPARPDALPGQEEPGHDRGSCGFFPHEDSRTMAHAPVGN